MLGVLIIGGAGVQEWQNAIFLMLNIVSGNSYNNTFKESPGGERMRISYFLSDRTRLDAPIVQRIAGSCVRELDAEEGESGGEAASLHLFCRAAPHTGASKDVALDSLGYVYFGRAQYLSHCVNDSRIELDLELRDYALIRPLAPFQQLLDLAKRP